MTKKSKKAIATQSKGVGNYNTANKIIMIIVIIGGGAVGLNCVLEISKSHPNDDIFLLEAETYLGMHTSTRNSEVIHAGFAYPKDSLKAKLCLEGNPLSFELCKTLDVPARQSGKWIVAFSNDEAAALDNVLKNIKVCNVPGVSEKNPNEVKKALPWLNDAKRALFLKTSGIIDTSEYISALSRILSTHSNCNVLTNCKLEQVDTAGNTIKTTRGEMPFDLLINSAGLFADEVYKMTGGQRNFLIKPFKGEYYLWNKAPFNELVYPVPTAFLKQNDPTLVSNMGIHVHSSIAGDKYIGPSQKEISIDKKTDYKIETPSEVFVAETKRYLKNPPMPEDITPAQAGNRPKLFENNKPIGDFIILKENNFIHLMGIESPGLTAAPAIARLVNGMIN
ncbi:MAG: hypothetical protein COS89_07380 [Deltaproteobacteria bacterium CG07_land_8_20_14_0_80_38_7]|nr:MAG: hypothetical protein COS89_07380 [Deltaproteobacteria bacterium CG07_land_8_20_14_0_80_38_7]